MTVNFKKYIQLHEVLDAEEKEEVATWHRDPEALKHTDHYFGVGVDDKYEQLHGTDNKSEIHRAIEHHLGQNINHNEYRAGHAKDKYGRPVRIGALLQRTKAPDELIKGFANDSTRQGKKFTGLTVRTTRSREGVAGQTSGGQSWEQQSCKNIRTGSNKHYLPEEVKHGTVVSYLHDHTGKEIARTTFQPHINNEGHRMYKINSSYGIDHAGFKEHNKKTESELSGPHKGGNIDYGIHDDVYNDNQVHSAIHPNVTTEDLHKSLNDDTMPYGIRADILAHPNLGEKAINDIINGDNDEDKEAILDRDDLTPHHLDKLLSSENKYVRQKTVSHKNMTPDLLDKGFKDINARVRQLVLQHPNTRPERFIDGTKDTDDNVSDTAWRSKHIPKAMIDDVINNHDLHSPAGYNVAHALTQSPNLTHEHISKLLKHNFKNIREMASYHKNLDTKHADEVFDGNDNMLKTNLLRNQNPDIIKPKHIDKILNHKDVEIRRLAAGHVNASDTQLHHFLNDEVPNVRNEVLSLDNPNPNITEHHIDKALDDKNTNIRSWAAMHSRASNANLHKALSDPDEGVRGDAIKNKNATPDVLRRAMSDKSKHNRTAAYYHPNADFTVHALASKEDVKHFRKTQNPWKN